MLMRSCEPIACSSWLSLLPLRLLILVWDAVEGRDGLGIVRGPINKNKIIIDEVIQHFIM